MKTKSPEDGIKGDLDGSSQSGSRRNFLMAGGGLLTGAALLGTSTQATAQASNEGCLIFETFKDARKKALTIGREMENISIEMWRHPPDLWSLERLRYLDLNARLILAETARARWKNVDEAREYLQRDNAHLFDIFREQKVRIMPHPEEIEQIDISGIEVVPNSGFSMVQAAGKGDCPGKMEVTLDVIFEAMGLVEITSLLFEVIEEMSDLKNKAGEVEGAFSNMNIREIMEALVGFVGFLLERGVIEKFLDGLSRKTRRKFLKVISARMIPFVGPALMAAGIVVAVHKHWDRIICNPDAQVS